MSHYFEQIGFLAFPGGSIMIPAEAGAKTTVAAQVRGEQASLVGTEAWSESETAENGALEVGNYPNPFNPQTLIRFTVPATQHVTLHVFDALGRRVAVLVDEVRSAGAHEVAFDASSLPSGMYFYRLQAGGLVRGGSMIHAK